MSVPSFQIRSKWDNSFSPYNRSPFADPHPLSLSLLTASKTTMSSSASAFVPRPYPPPSLAGVPNEYILNRLHHLAPHYWNKPETADCTIGECSSLPISPTGAHLIAIQSSMTLQSPSPPPEESDRPSLESHSRSVFPFSSLSIAAYLTVIAQAHIDYLCSQSRLLRRFFGGSTAASASVPPLSSRPPQFLSSSNSHPVVYLPIPDPSSFDLLLHWMYHGSVKDIELALDDGVVTWEGLARNVEYLDIRDHMRQFLGRWYARRRALCDESDSDESSGSEEDEIFSPIENPIVDPDTDADSEDEHSSDGADEKCSTRSPKKIMSAVDVPRLLAKSKPLRVTIQ